MNDIDDVSAKIRKATEDRADLERTKQVYDDRRKSQDRSIIVAVVIGVYALVVLGCVGFLIYDGIANHSNAFANISEVLKIGVVPVVTLVIGYYFGSAKSE